MLKPLLAIMFRHNYPRSIQGLSKISSGTLKNLWMRTQDQIFKIFIFITKIISQLSRKIQLREFSFSSFLSKCFLRNHLYPKNYNEFYEVNFGFNLRSKKYIYWIKQSSTVVPAFCICCFVFLDERRISDLWTEKVWLTTVLSLRIINKQKFILFLRVQSKNEKPKTIKYSARIVSETIYVARSNLANRSLYKINKKNNKKSVVFR